MKILRFRNKEVPFVARVVEKGDVYGLNFCLQHEDEVPLIEFYDGRTKSAHAYQKDGIPLGQFVSRYTLPTFADIKTGLFLDSGSTDWSLTMDNVKTIQEWASAVSSLKNKPLDISENKLKIK